jgi:hypothetical protein
MFVTLRGCRFDCNGCYSWWNNDPCFWVTLGNGVIDYLAIVRPVCRHRKNVGVNLSICSGRFGNSEMSPTSSGVNSTATSLALRLVFHQALRQTGGLLRSIADVLKIDIAIPDHTTLSRHGGGLTILPKQIDRTEPLHLLVDSTGLKIYGEGEWFDQKHSVLASAMTQGILESVPIRMRLSRWN